VLVLELVLVLEGVPSNAREGSRPRDPPTQSALYVDRINNKIIGTLSRKDIADPAADRGDAILPARWVEDEHFGVT
jgi:hypothetical protein